MTSQLLQIIENKERLNSDTAKIITQELLTPDFFSVQESEMIANWYGKISSVERTHLLSLTEFSQALEFDFERDECCIFSPEKIDEIFSKTTYQLTPKTKHWMKNNVFFPKIKLPSGVQIQTNAQDFFKTLAEGLDVFPHLIDELKRAAYLIPCLYMVPCNYVNMLGSCRLNSFQIKLKDDEYNEATLKNLLHEIGHATSVRFRDKQANKIPLIDFTDEAEQYAKTTYIELFQENLEDNPLLSLAQYINKQLRQKYPTMSDEKLERATAVLTKREITWLHLLRNEQLHFVLDKWQEDKIIDNRADFTYDYADLIAHRWDFYTQYYALFHSLYKDKDTLKKQLMKRYGEPTLITKYLSKRDLLSGDFCAELMGRGGYVDVPTESLRPFHLERVYFKPQNTVRGFFFKAYIDCTGLSNEGVKRVKQAYLDYGAKLKRSKNLLYTTSFMGVRQVYKLISNDFSNSPIRLGHSFYKIDRKQLSAQVDEELSELFDKSPITVIANEDEIIVDKVQLNHYGYTFNAPVYGGCIWQIEEEFLTSQKVETCVKRWQQKGFHPVCMPLTEKYALFLFPEKEIDRLNAYFEKVQFVSAGLDNSPQSMKGIPNPIKSKKVKLKKEHLQSKSHIRE